jgi:hypothetical protein
MDKVIQFSTHDSLGKCFAEALTVSHAGSGHEKIAGELHSEIKLFIRNIKPDPRYQYVLMTPMGAFEYWGMNVNGDIFPEISLSYDLRGGDPIPVAKALEDKWLKPFGKHIPPGNYKEFGHQTFSQALRYRHHANKNREIAYGDIVFVIYNPAMKRVELISRHDREKAKRVGAEEIINDLDNGNPRQISMGCKVPFDVCTCCGHISTTPRDYCEHLRFEMGSVRSDGKIVGAVNFFPRFFDLSDVFVPAAKESGVLMKVARDLRAPAVKQAALKAAEVRKEILPNATNTALLRTSASERPLPDSLLDKGTLSKLLTTLALLGIVLKPEEFQYSTLSRSGHGDLASRLRSRGEVFRPRQFSSPLVRMSPDDYDPSIARAASGLLPHRSAFYPHLPARILKITVIRRAPTEKVPKIVDSDMLGKVANAYASYRHSLRDLDKTADVAMCRDPKYYNQHFLGDLLLDTMTKTSSFHAATSDTPLVRAYLYSAHRGTVSSVPTGWCDNLTSNSPARVLFGPVL